MAGRKNGMGDNGMRSETAERGGEGAREGQVGFGKVVGLAVMVAAKTGPNLKAWVQVDPSQQI